MATINGPLSVYEYLEVKTPLMEGGLRRGKELNDNGLNTVFGILNIHCT